MSEIKNVPIDDEEKAPDTALPGTLVRGSWDFSVTTRTKQTNENNKTDHVMTSSGLRHQAFIRVNFTERCASSSIIITVSYRYTPPYSTYMKKDVYPAAKIPSSQAEEDR